MHDPEYEDPEALLDDIDERSALETAELNENEVIEQLQELHRQLAKRRKNVDCARVRFALGLLCFIHKKMPRSP